MFDSPSERQYPAGMPDVQPAASAAPSPPAAPAATNLTSRQREILEVIDRYMRERGYPPSVREIGEAVGLTSPSTVHNHLASLQRTRLPAARPHQAAGHRGPLGPASDAALERRPSRSVPLVGDVAAGTDVLAQENVEELLPLPADFTGDGDLFMLRVRGDSMIDAGILDGDYVVARPAHRRATATSSWPASPARRRRSRPIARKGAKVHAAPGQPPAGADGVRRRATSRSSAGWSRCCGGSDGGPPAAGGRPTPARAIEPQGTGAPVRRRSASAR